MSDFLVSALKGMYPAYLLLAIWGIGLRMRRGEWKWQGFDTLLLGMFLLFELPHHQIRNVEVQEVAVAHADGLQVLFVIVIVQVLRRIRNLRPEQDDEARDAYPQQQQRDGSEAPVHRVVARQVDLPADVEHLEELESRSRHYPRDEGIDKLHPCVGDGHVE